MRRIARVVVGRKVYAGQVRNSRGNLIDTWADPVDVKVYAVYKSAGSEPGSNDRVITDLTMLTPPGFECAPHDRFIVAGREYNVADGELADWTTGPYDYKPGGEIGLERVDG